MGLAWTNGNDMGLEQIQRCRHLAKQGRGGLVWHHVLRDEETLLLLVLPLGRQRASLLRKLHEKLIPL